jgi:CheY-like chemotaxis protein
MEAIAMKFLVVDDDFVTLSKLTAILGGLGVCEAATNGDQACALIDEACSSNAFFDAAIIDINLPCQSGWSVLQSIRLKEQAAARECKKIIITSAGTQQNVVRSCMFRCDAFLVKPIRREVLLERLAKLGIPSPANSLPAGEAPGNPSPRPSGA